MGGRCGRAHDPVPRGTDDSGPHDVLRVGPDHLRTHGPSSGDTLFPARRGGDVERGSVPCVRQQARLHRRRPRNPVGLCGLRELVGSLALLRRRESTPGRPRNHVDYDSPRKDARADQVLADPRDLHDRHDPGRARVADGDVPVLRVRLSQQRLVLD